MLKKVYLALEIRDALSFLLSIDQLALAVLNFASQEPDFVHLLLIVNLSFLQRRFLNFDFLIQQVQLLISFDQLGRENITLIHYHFIVFLLLGLLSFSLRDDILETGNVVFLRFNHFLGGNNLLSNLSNRLLQFGIFLHVLAPLCIFLLFLVVLDNRLFLQLADVAGHPLKVGFELLNLRVGLEQVF